MPWRPEVPGERPTLGPVAVEWIEASLGSPDGGSGLVTLTREQVDFTLRFLELDPETGRRRFRRAVLSRAKAWGRSPFLAMLALAEAFAAVVPDGWDANGRPVGRPWSSIRTPWVQILAVSEDQTRNAWWPLQEMLRDGPAGDLRGVDVLETFVVLPGGGRIEYATSSGVSREGNRPVFAILDQSESWTKRNGGTRLAAAVRRNLGKTGGSSVEAPNSYRPGSGSVSEASFEYHQKIVAGEAADGGLLWDHREAPPSLELKAGVTDEELAAGLRYAYGDSSADPRGCVLHDPPCPPGWVDLTRIVREIRDLDTEQADAALYYLNRPSSPEDSFITKEMLDRLPRPARPLEV
jgi:hypothetical protein